MHVAFLALLLSASPLGPQESATPFDAPLVTLGYDDRYGVLIDFDQDGFLDAVSWWYRSGYTGGAKLTGWHNDGRGGFSPVWTTTISVHPAGGPPNERSVRIFTCNLDSDGLQDFYLVFNSRSALSIRAFRSRGLELPEVMTPYSVGWVGDVSEMHAVLTDFTGDGLADVAHTLDSSLRLLEYVPGEPIVVGRASLSPFGTFTDNIQGLKEIDANGDATPDLLVWKGASVKLIAVQDCRPTSTQTFTQGITDHHMPAVGDVDGDGDADLVIWDMTRYVLARRTGPAAWSFEAPVTGGPAEYLVDVDGDGDLDGVCCGGGLPDPTYNTRVSTFRISLNDGSGRFAPALERSWLGSDHLAGVVDIDHDGDLDVVSGRCILYGRGPLVDEPHPPLGTRASERSTADLDGDSDPDYAVGMRPMFRNLGAGPGVPHAATFPADPALVGPGWPGDFDGDGDVDLIVKRRIGTTLLGQHLLRNQGGGAFVDAGLVGHAGVDFLPDVVGADDPESSLAADVDGDGDLDLVTRSSVSGPRISRVWWNGGTSGFQAGPVFADEVVREVADLTGDGLPEIIGVTTSLGWHAALGGGAFGPLVALDPLRAYLDRFALADLDADGDLDFAVATDFQLQLHWNDGGGVFTRQTQWQVAFSTDTQPPRRVWSSDVDQDGLLDLMLLPTRYEPNGVQILQRESDNLGWRAPYSQIVWPHDGNVGIVLEPVMRDVDGDLDVDLVTDRVVRNGTYSPPVGGERWQNLGGVAGTGGLVPTLGADGPFRPGQTATLHLRGGVGGARGEVIVYSAEGVERGRSADGSRSTGQYRIVTRIPFVLDGTPGEAGCGSWSHTYAVPWGFAGREVGHVAELVDAGSADGFARSNGLWLRYGD